VEKVLRRIAGGAILMLLVSGMLLFGSNNLQAKANGVNLVGNGGFELDSDWIWSELSGRVANEKYSGSYCLLLSTACTQGSQSVTFPNLTSHYFSFKYRPSSDFQGPIIIEDSSAHSCLELESVDESVVSTVGELVSNETLQNGWREIIMRFTPSFPQMMLRLGQNHGEAYFDDVYIGEDPPPDSHINPSPAPQNWDWLKIPVVTGLVVIGVIGGLTYWVISRRGKK
jgi:hypothetical protein